MSDRAVQEMISGLVKDLEPVKPQATPRVFAAGSLVFGLALVGASVSILGVRAGLEGRLADSLWLLEAVAGLSFLVFASLAGGLLTSPGRASGLQTKAWAFFALPLGGLLLLPRLIGLDWSDSGGGAGLRCVLTAVAVAIVASGLMFLSLRRRAAFRPALTGVVAGLFGISAGFLVIMLHCPSDDSLHIWLSHIVLPWAVVVCVASAIGSRLLRW